MYFLDTSVLLKSYLPEKGSQTVHDAFKLLDGSLFVSDVVLLEAASKLSKKLRKAEISEAVYDNAHKLLRWDMLHRFASVPVDGALPTAVDFAHQYRDRSPGSLDLLHVATAEYLQSLYPAEPVWLLTSDERLIRLAATRNLDVFDPERDDLKALIPPPPLGLVN